MRNKAIRFFKVAALLGIGAICGPILSALWAATMASLQPAASERVKDTPAWNLLEAYRAQLPPLRLLLSIVMPPDGEECRYSRSALFGEKEDILEVYASAPDHWSSYKGYDALNHWKNTQTDERYLQHVVRYLALNTSAFSATFLENCIRNTALRSVCVRYTEDMLSERPWFGKPTPMPTRRFEAPVEAATLCTYLDGVAARRGKPLSDWPKAGVR
jgi:hypothetical protein